MLALIPGEGECDEEIGADLGIAVGSFLYLAGCRKHENNHDFGNSLSVKTLDGPEFGSR